MSRRWSEKIQFCKFVAAVILIVSVTACGNFFVSGNTVVSISLSPINPTIQVGGTEQFVATGTTANGTSEDVTPGARWSSSNTAISTINSAGLARATGDGTATITAKYQEGTAQTFLTVTSATLTAITISPANASISVGGTEQYTATGTYSDGTTRNITSSVTWSSNYTNVATITAAGLATGIGAGSTVIIATLGSITASTTLTVT